MLKIVPDPPTLLEETLVQTTEHVLCALARALMDDAELGMAH